MKRMRDAEEGAVAVTTALLLIILILFAALIVDLGRLRVDRSASQAVADFAATAGVADLRVFGIVEACEVAVDYAAANLPVSMVDEEAARTAAETECAARFASLVFTCNNETAVAVPPAVIPVGAEYTIEVTYPVFQDTPLMNAQAGRESDGEPCERLGVAVTRQGEYILASVVGLEADSTTVSAVALDRETGDEKEVATLIVLRAQECQVISTSGGAGIIVFNGENDEGQVVPGIITADSTDTGCATNKTVYGTSGGGYLCAGVAVESGTTESQALQDIDSEGRCRLNGDGPQGARTQILPDSLRVWADNPAVWSTEGGVGSMEPDITPGERITRGLADHAYNCDPHSEDPVNDPDEPGVYPDYASGTPQYPVAGPDEPEIPGCTTRSIAAIDKLVDAFITKQVHNGVALTGPAAFTTFTCAPNATTPARFVILDCGGSPGNVTLPDAEIVVVRRFGLNAPNARGIALTGGNSLTIGSAGGQDAMMIVPQGSISYSGGSLFLHNTFTYLHEGNSTFSNTSSAAQIFTAPQEDGWISPEDPDEADTPDNCELHDANVLLGVASFTLPTLNTVEIPDTSCFENLALWSNGWGTHKLTGSVSIDVRGIFFTPNAGRSQPNSGGFELAGNDAVGAGLDLTDAQFFTWRLVVSGQKPVFMRPDPNIFLGDPVFGRGLIR